ncbi:uncharacterized protein MELLADRAFT_112222 [Melampsora larici-populina 98AG31]|uniref:Uncharacterized protein n=1 Tax=Melampsora larici-populina (strain 98AG31 / pathotype 3-4-7) TaxID=747676 RepID=F4S5S0_MELLP|nr:uncharacterized protein MELLADRAFT_112222 [Melampsora larici-populina 98AG31]EGG00016.1 hypothetical protein MELLADRAFT_112222 [Melampsora larici-populina 98AG31]
MPNRHKRFNPRVWPTTASNHSNAGKILTITAFQVHSMHTRPFIPVTRPFTPGRLPTRHRWHAPCSDCHTKLFKSPLRNNVQAKLLHARQRPTLLHAHDGTQQRLPSCPLSLLHDHPSGLHVPSFADVRPCQPFQPCELVQHHFRRRLASPVFHTQPVVQSFDVGRRVSSRACAAFLNKARRP